MQSLLKRPVVSCLGAFILLVVFPLAGFAQGYSDDFEAATFNPFWTLVQQNGTIALSTAQSYSGNQSGKLTGTGRAPAFNWITRVLAASMV